MDEIVRNFADKSSILYSKVSPDQRKVAFFWNKNDCFGLFIYDLYEDDLSLLTEGCASDPAPGDILWTKDSRKIFFVEEDNDDYFISEVSMKGSSDRLFKTSRDTVLWDCTSDRVYFIQNFRDSGDFKYLDMESETVLDFENYSFCHINGGRISPKEDRLVYTSKLDEENFEVIISNLDGKDRRSLNLGDGLIYCQDWSEDGSKLLVGRGSEKHGWECGIFHLDTNTVDWLADCRPIAFIDNNSFIAVDEKVRIFNPNGKCRTLDIDYKNFFDPTNAKDVLTEDGFIFISRTKKRPKELYKHNIQSEKTERVVSVLKEDLDTVEPEKVSFNSNNKKGEGYIYDSGIRPSPVVTWVYGATDNYNSFFDPRIQILANLGYTVFQPVYKGEPFQEKEHDFFAAAGKWIKNQDWADEDRVGLFGHSHGGYNVLMQLVKHPNLWSCGISSCGIYDLLKAHHDGDATQHIYWNLGDPEENSNLWKEQSPINKIENIQKPIQILYGAKDNISNTQTKHLNQKLVKNGFKKGKDFKIEKLEGTGHYTYDKKARYQKWTKITQFLQENL